MGDYKLFGGAVSGPAIVRQNIEMTPYGTDYRRTELHLGLENTNYVPVFVPASWARVTLLFDGSFEDTAGGQINWGSRRTAGFLRAGLRFRLTPPGVIVMDVKGGVGVASNDLNFGKGIYPPHEYSFNIQAQATVGAVFCLNPDFCLGPVVGVSVDQAFSTGRDYTSGHFPFLGFRIEGQVNPPPVVSASDPYEKEKKEYEDRIKTILQEKEIWRTKYKEIVKRDGAKPDARPPVPTPAQARKPDSPLPAPAQSPVRSKFTDEKKPHIVEKTIERAEYDWFNELPNYFRFQNDKADLLPRSQTYPVCKKNCGEGNPDLNVIISTVRRWAGGVADLKRGKPAYRMDITIHGFANETGKSEDDNRQLAQKRAEVVVNYLLGSSEMPYVRRDRFGEIVPPLGQQDVGSISGAKISDIVSVRSLEVSLRPSDDIIKIITGKRREELSQTELDKLTDKLQSDLWRKVIVTYTISKLDGEKYQQITVDQYIQERLEGMTQHGEKPKGVK